MNIVKILTILFVLLSVLALLGVFKQNQKSALPSPESLTPTGNCIEILPGASEAVYLPMSNGVIISLVTNGDGKGLWFWGKVNPKPGQFAEYGIDHQRQHVYLFRVVDTCARY